MYFHSILHSPEAPRIGDGLVSGGRNFPGPRAIGSCEIGRLEGGVEEKRGAVAGLRALWAVPD
jgi:hypothetical protein